MDREISTDIAFCAAVFPLYSKELNSRVAKPDALLRYSVFANAIGWSDEAFESDDDELRRLYFALICLRSALITGNHTHEIEQLFSDLRGMCPNWSFLSIDRCSGQMLSVLEKFQEEASLDLDAAFAELETRRMHKLS